LPHGSDKLDEPLKGIVFALDRNQDRCGCRQGILGERPEGRWTIDKHNIETSRLKAYQVVPKPRVSEAPLGGPMLKVSSRRDAGDTLPRRSDNAPIGRKREGSAGIYGFGAHAAGGIRLGVHVNDEDPASRQAEGMGQGGGGGRFADAAFLICHCKDAGHGLFPRGCIVSGNGLEATENSLRVFPAGL
jgi:hypothetical protein